MKVRQKPPYISKDILDERMAHLGLNAFSLSKKVVEVRSQLYGDRIRKPRNIYNGVVKVLAAPEKSSSEMLEYVVVALGGKI